MGLRGSQASSGDANEREGEALLSLGEKLLHAPAVDEVFEAGLLAVGAIAVLGEDANHGGGDGDGLIGAEQNAAVGGKLLVAGDAAEQDAKVDAGGDALPSVTRTAMKPMSLVSATTLMEPPLSKAILNLRGRPYMSRELRM